MPPSRKGLRVVGQAGGERVALHLLARFLHQVGEGRQRYELASGEEVAQSSCRSCRRESRVPAGRIRHPASTPALPCSAIASMLWRRREIHTPAVALGHDRHQPRAHPPALPSALM